MFVVFDDLRIFSNPKDILLITALFSFIFYINKRYVALKMATLAGGAQDVIGATWHQLPRHEGRCGVDIGKREFVDSR